MTYYCAVCQKNWNYRVEKCIFCGADLHARAATMHTVVGFTEVNIPSVHNEVVPYFAYVLVDENKNKTIWKSFQKYDIGDEVDVERDAGGRHMVGVVGTGLLGSGIATYLIQRGFRVVIKTRSDQSKASAEQKITNKLLKAHTQEQTQDLLKNLHITTNFADLHLCDIVIEAGPEDLAIKREIFHALSSVCKEDAILATNTSSLSIFEIAQATDRPDKVIGLHFFNPVSKMKLVEVIIGKQTSQDTNKTVTKFSKQIGKEPVHVSDSPGFLVNRLLLLQINEAVHLLEENIATKEEIDMAMKLGVNHPMGPFALADFIGIDTCVSILETLHKTLKQDQFRPARTLCEMVDSRRLGVKTKDGFYNY
jgi:3-hydroxybutyryl-CoA dehydrogenase